jgi:hypothetical protein
MVKTLFRPYLLYFLANFNDFRLVKKPMWIPISALILCHRLIIIVQALYLLLK